MPQPSRLPQFYDGPELAGPSFDSMQNLSRYPALPQPSRPELADTSRPSIAPPQKPALRLQTKNFTCPNAALVRTTRKLQQLIDDLSPPDSGYASATSARKKACDDPHWSRFVFDFDKAPAPRISQAHAHISPLFFNLGLLAPNHRDASMYGPFVLTDEMAGAGALVL